MKLIKTNKNNNLYEIVYYYILRKNIYIFTDKPNDLMIMRKHKVSCNYDELSSLYTLTSFDSSNNLIIIDTNLIDAIDRYKEAFRLSLSIKNIYSIKTQ
jgi:hypothetical protein